MRKLSVAGLFVLLIGFVLLLNAAGIIALSGPWFVLPLGVIFTGSASIVIMRRFSVFAAVMLLAGGYWMLWAFGIVPNITDAYVVPLLVMLAGLLLLMPALLRDRPGKNTLDELAIFKTTEREVNGYGLARPRVRSALGGVSLYISDDAPLPKNVRLDSTVVCGGLTVYLPDCVAVRRETLFSFLSFFHIDGAPKGEVKCVLHISGLAALSLVEAVYVGETEEHEPDGGSEAE